MPTTPRVPVRRCGASLRANVLLHAATALIALASSACGGSVADDPVPPVGAVVPRAPEVCSDPAPTRARVDFVDVGEVGAIKAEDGALYLGLRSLRIGGEGAVYRARFETGALEAVAPAFSGGALLVQGSQLFYTERGPDRLDGSYALDDGPLYAVDLSTGTRRVLGGPHVFFGRAVSLAERGEIAFIGLGDGPTRAAVWTWHTAHGFRRHADATGELLGDGAELYQVEYDTNEEPPRTRISRLDRMAGRWLPLFELPNASQQSFVGIERDAFFVYDRAAARIRVLDSGGGTARTLESPALDSDARVHVAADAVYVSSGATITRIDKASGIEQAVATLDDAVSPLTVVTSDACYLYVTGGGLRSVTRIPKPAR